MVEKAEQQFYISGYVTDALTGKVTNADSTASLAGLDVHICYYRKLVVMIVV